MTPHGILFDLDGTLLDTNTQHVEAWCEALAAFRVALAPDRLGEEIGKGGDILIPTLLGPETERAEGEAMRRAHQMAFRELFSRGAPRWFEGTEAVLAAARRAGLRTALATSTGKEDLAFLEERLGVRFESLFDVVVTATKGEPSKPEPNILEKACEQLGLHPLQCAMVGDSLHDAEAARRAGLAFLGVTTGFISAPRFREVGARFIASGVGELAAKLPEALAAAWHSRVAFQRAEVERMMRVALDAAEEALDEGESAIGAAFFGADGELLMKGHNRVLATGDLSDHAEMDALRALARAGKKLGPGATMVSTLEPCVMCLGAAMMSAVDVVLFALRAPADGGTRRMSVPRGPQNVLPRVRGGILAAESRQAFQRWLDRGGEPAQRPFVEQLLRETAQG
jgi:membrane protein